jgi:hypothetical protein
MSPRHVLIPLLIYCEGLHDRIFINYLCRLYRDKTSGYYFDIRHGDGGSPESLVIKASRLPGDYSERVVIFDNDRGPNDLRAAEAAASRLSVSLSYFSPSLEHILLSILQPGRSFTHMSTPSAKTHFHANYIAESKRGNADAYDHLFPKTVVDQMRVSLVELDEKIRYFER